MNCPVCKVDNQEESLYCGRCGAFLDPSFKTTDSHTKTFLGGHSRPTSGYSFTKRYKIIEELGSGGMGTVYKVEDKEIKEVIALKLLKRDIATDKENIQRFQNELKYTRKINHKNVCQMYHLSRDKNNFFITMEYVRGQDLKSIIRIMGQMSAGKAVFIAKQVCEGLAAAHKLGVVHRDLKPQNIMIDKEGNARIMDFGIARSIEAKGITVSGVMIGTPEYMSPEQVEGKDIDFRSDIYSLGIILYELLSGKSPFAGEKPLSVALKHKTEVPIEPKDLNTQIPNALNKVILKCIEKDREKRFQSVEDLFIELKEMEKSLPNTARIIPKRRTNISKRVRDTLSLKKRLISAFVVLIIMTAVISITSYIISKKHPKKNSLPINEQMNISENAFTSVLAPDGKFYTNKEALVIEDESVGSMYTPKYSPDRKKIAIHWDRNPSRGIWVISQKNPSQTLIYEGDTWPIGWTADGKSIYGVDFFSDGIKILKIALENKQIEILGSFSFDTAKYMRPSVHMTTNGKYFVFSMLEKK